MFYQLKSERNSFKIIKSKTLLKFWARKTKIYFYDLYLYNYLLYLIIFRSIFCERNFFLFSYRRKTWKSTIEKINNIYTHVSFKMSLPTWPFVEKLHFRTAFRKRTSFSCFRCSARSRCFELVVMLERLICGATWIGMTNLIGKTENERIFHSQCEGMPKVSWSSQAILSFYLWPYLLS